MPSFVRNTLFRLVRRDALRFLEDHEEDLLVIFRQEMQKMDDRIPEEQALIDIHMVPLGEEVLKATLNTFKRFLKEC
jgi:hypothetical protein